MKNYNAETFGFIIKMMGSLGISVVDPQIWSFSRQSLKNQMIIWPRLWMTNKPQTPEWILHTLREAAWAPASVFLLYLVARHFQLYQWFPPFDIPTHFMGGIAITYFFRVAIRQSQKLVWEIPFPVQALLAFTCTGTTTIFWEFYEYLSDFFFHTQMVRGVTDTMVDLFVGLLGALASSVLYRQR